MHLVRVQSKKKFFNSKKFFFKKFKKIFLKYDRHLIESFSKIKIQKIYNLTSTTCLSLFAVTVNVLKISFINGGAILRRNFPANITFGSSFFIICLNSSPKTLDLSCSLAFFFNSLIRSLYSAILKLNLKNFWNFMGNLGFPTWESFTLGILPLVKKPTR